MTTATETREERRERMRRRFSREREQLVEATRRGEAEELNAAARKTSMAYLWDRKWREWTLTGPIDATVHTGCTPTTITLPAGTQGWIHVSREYTYDKYVRIGDEDYPAKDAKVKSTKSYYTFACLTTYEGKTVLVDAMKVTSSVNG